MGVVPSYRQVAETGRSMTILGLIVAVIVILIVLRLFGLI